MKCLILAGGSGDALWPLSRKNYPKQFIYIKEGRSLFQEAIARNLPFCDEFLIAANEKYQYIIEGQLQAFQGLKYHCILEEEKRQTAPAVAVGCMCMDKGEQLLVVSTDHVIGEGDYKGTILAAKERLTPDNIVVIGAKRSEKEESLPLGHSYFAYEGNTVTGFYAQQPQQTVSADADMLLDSGIFLTYAGTYLEALRECQPKLYQMLAAGENRVRIRNDAAILNESFSRELPSVSIGEGIYAKWAGRNQSRLQIETARFEWSRLLNIEVLSKFADEKHKENVLLSDCRNVSVINEEKNHLIVANELEDLVIVETKDATYLSKRGSSDRIKTILKEHYARWKDIFDEGAVYYTTWGMKETLTRSEGYTVKKLTIFPGKSLSAHKHERRSEHWSIVSGTATITMYHETKEYHRNESVYVPPHTYHQISNQTAEDLVVIEVSVGESAGQKVGDLVPEKDDIFRLAPAYKDYLWGGSRLSEQFGKDNHGKHIAESWELSTHPAGESVIASGHSAGMTLTQYLQEEGKEILGWKCEPFERFPLLIKFIDARKRLSIQVHPGDEYALKVEGEYGKNEMWYILDAAEGAFVYAGFTEDMTEEECRRRIAEGALEEVLHKVPVKAGDVIFIEAGCVHAINEGILVLEIQQSSNATYRLYDYDRLDADGQRRPLHLDKAFANLNLKKKAVSTSPEGEKEQKKGYVSQLLGECKYFSAIAYEVETRAELSLDDSTFTSVTFLEGEGTIATPGRQLAFRAGDSFFVTAGKKVLTIGGKCRFILSRI
ncbi:MAG: cupin domain-containing protein [Lachnospiraceae bacterium]|nr:cupin domain-containing protein [Lachnospiraceae bacterium]